MNQAAFLLDDSTIYWYSLILSMAVMTGICFYLACCAHEGIRTSRALFTALVGMILSMLLSRLLYWYCRPSTFPSAREAFTSLRSDTYALGGAFAGCSLAALLTQGRQIGKTLDCMSVGGCAAIALGRLGNFATTADRGPVLLKLQSLPWASPVTAATGAVENRLATFVLQSMAAALLLVVLLALLFGKKNRRAGDLTILFLLVYCSSQIVLDSTRYDALHLRSNGFINMVQLLCAIVLVVLFVILSVRAVKCRALHGFRMIALFLASLALLGGAGYMEYYVQRHARLAAQSYAVMSLCLAGIVLICLRMYHMGKARPAHV